MLNHTKRIKEIYEDIQKKLFYMIPEKWESLFLYCSILDHPDKEGKTGELFFYYIPKGIFKKKPVNVYEIPAKFNLEENQYLRLVQMLYSKIKELRKEFQKEDSNVWTNLTMSIQNLRFKVEYDYSDLSKSDFSSYERHVIWRYEKLGVGEEQISKQDKNILKRYKLGARQLTRKEHYEAGIYMQDIENRIDYSTQDDSKTEKVEQVIEKTIEHKHKNQILLSQEEIEKMQKKSSY